MKSYYYAETDSLYIDLSGRENVDSIEAAPGVVLDFAADNRLVGIDIDQASHIGDLSRLEAQALPVSGLRIATS